MDNITSLYSKLQQAQDIQLPPLEEFKQKYNSPSGMDSLYTKLQGVSSIQLPDKESFKTKYLTVTTAPTAPTKPTSINVSSPTPVITTENTDSKNILHSPFDFKTSSTHALTEPQKDFTSTSDPRTFSDVLFGKGEFKKAIDEGKKLTNVQPQSPYELFLKSSAKDLTGTFYPDLNKLPEGEDANFYADVSQKASQKQESYNNIIKQNIPWEQKSKQLTSFFEDISKNLQEEKNNLTSSIEDNNIKINYYKDEIANKKKEWEEAVHQGDFGKQTSYYGKLYQSNPTEAVKVYENEISTLENHINDLSPTKIHLANSLDSYLKDKEDFKALAAAPAQYLNPLAQATRDNPQSLLTLPNSELLFQAAKYNTEAENMIGEEKKRGSLQPFEQEFQGKKLKELLDSKFDITKMLNPFEKITYLGANTTSTNISNIAKFSEKANINLEDIQRNAYSGFKMINSNVDSNIKYYENTLKELTTNRNEIIAQAAKNNEVISPEWLQKTNQEINEIPQKIEEQKLLKNKLDNLGNEYFSNYRDWLLYKQSADKNSQILSGITIAVAPTINKKIGINPTYDVVQPLWLGLGKAINSVPSAIQTYRDLAENKVGLLSKEEQVARQLYLTKNEDYNQLDYVPEPLQNTQPIKLDYDKNGINLKGTHVDPRAALREGIKATANSILLYETGAIIGEATGAEALLGKESSGKLANYFSDKVGILPASMLLMDNDVRSQKMKSYINGDVKSINQVIANVEASKFKEGATEMTFTPEFNLIKSIEGRPVKEFALAQLFQKTLGKKLITPELNDMIRIISQNLIATPLGESFEEVENNLYNDIYEQATSGSTLEVNPKQFTLENNIETVLNTSISMLPTMVGGLGRSYMQQNPHTLSLNYELAANADQYINYAHEFIFSDISDKKLKRIFPDYVSKENLFNKVKNTNNFLKETYNAATPVTSLLIEDSDKINYFNALNEYRLLSQETNPKQIERNQPILEGLNAILTKYTDKALSIQQDYQTDYVKGVVKHLPETLSQLDFQSINIPVLEEVNKHIDKIINVLEDRGYEDKIEKLNELKQATLDRITKLREESLKPSEVTVGDTTSPQGEAVSTTTETPTEKTSTTLQVSPKIQEYNTKIENLTLETFSDLKNQILQDEDLSDENGGEKDKLFQLLTAKEKELIRQKKTKIWEKDSQSYTLGDYVKLKNNDTYYKIEEITPDSMKLKSTFKGGEVTIPLSDPKDIEKILTEDEYEEYEAEKRVNKRLENKQPTQVENTTQEDKKTNIERQAEFKNAGEQSKKEGNATAIANDLLQNAKVGDTITDKNGEGYEVTEVNTRKDGTKEVVLVPFELIDGKKDYNYSGTRLISENNKKAASDLYEFSYTNSKGEKIIETYTYNAKYDAEYIDAVNKGEMTKEQAMKSLEEAGRKNSEAYAKLAALKEVKTLVSDIEKKYPEYVKNFKQSIFDIRDIVRRLGTSAATSKAEIFDNVADKFIGKVVTEDNIEEAIKGISVPGSKGFKRTFIEDIKQEFNKIGQLKKEYDAELDALEQAKKTVPNVEDKIADIERRKPEILNNYRNKLKKENPELSNKEVEYQVYKIEQFLNAIENDVFLIDDVKKIAEELFGTKLKITDAGTLLYAINDRNIKLGSNIRNSEFKKALLSSQFYLEYKEKGKIGLGDRLTKEQVDTLYKAINAKYDAKLAALEEKSLPQEVQEVSIPQETLEQESKELDEKNEKRIDYSGTNFNPFGAAPYFIPSKYSQDTYYITTLKVLENLRSKLLNNKDLSKEGIFVTVKKNTLPLDKLNPENRDFYNQGESQQKATRDGVILILTNENGDILYFDKEGNITSDEAEGIPVYQNFKKTFDGKTDPSQREIKEAGQEESYNNSKQEVLNIRETLDKHPETKFIYKVRTITAPIYKQKGEYESKLFSTDPESDVYAQVLSFDGQYVKLSQKGSTRSIHMPLLKDTNLMNTVKALLDVNKTKGLENTTPKERVSYIENFINTHPGMRFRFNEDGSMYVLNSRDNTTQTIEEFLKTSTLDRVYLNGNTSTNLNKPVIVWNEEAQEFQESKQNYGELIVSNLSEKIEITPEIKEQINPTIKLGEFVGDNNNPLVVPTPKSTFVPITPTTTEVAPQDAEVPTTKFPKKFADFKPKTNTLTNNKPLERSRTLPNKVSEKKVEAANNWFNTYMSKSGAFFKDMSNIVNSSAWATWQEGVVILWKGSNATDLYHEAFHDFTQMYLKPSQKKGLYEEALKTKEGQKALASLLEKNPNATQIEIYNAMEELLAEDFRNYMLSGQKLILNERPKRNSIFRKIYNFLKELFTSQPSLETIYKNLANNKLSTYNRDASNIMFGKLNKNIPSFTENETFNIHRALDSLLAQQYRLAGYFLSSLFKEPSTLNAAYNSSYNSILSSYESLKDNYNKYAEEYEVNPSEPLEIYLNNLLTEIDNTERVLANWENVVLSHKIDSPFLRLSSEIKALLDDFDEEDPQTKEGKFEFDDTQSIKTRASHQLIYLMASLPKYINVNGKQVPKYNSFLPFIQDTTEFDVAWNTVADTLKGEFDYNTQYKLLQDRAALDKFIEHLIESLPNPYSSLDTLSSQLRNQFIITFSQPLIPMKIVRFRYVDGSLKVEARDATISNLSTVQSDWSTNLQSSQNQYTKENPLGGRELDLPKVLNDFKRISKLSKQTKIDFLKALGITLSPQAENSKQFEEFLDSPYKLSNIYNALETLEKYRKENNKTTPITSIVQAIGKTLRDAEGKVILNGLQETELKELSDIEITTGNKYFGDNRLNSEGSSTWGIRPWSQQSVMYSYLNDYKKYPTYQSLLLSPIGRIFDIKLNPDANNIYLNSLFDLTTGQRRTDGKGNPTQIKLYNHDGIEILQDDNYQDAQGIKTASLSRFLKAIQDISTFLKTGEKEHPRYGDKTTSNGTLAYFPKFTSGRNINPHLPVNIEDFKDSYLPKEAYIHYRRRLYTALLRTNLYKTENILKDAENFSKNLEEGHYWGYFDGILSEKTKETLIEQGLLDIENLDINKLIDDNEKLIKEDIASYNEKMTKDYIANELESNKVLKKENYIDNYLFEKKFKNYDFETLIKAYLVNSYILNMEHISMFFQDVRFYDNKKGSFREPFKRFSKSSSTGTRMVNDDQINIFLQSQPNYEYQRYNKGREDKVQPDPTQSNKKIAIFNDTVVKNILDKAEFIKDIKEAFPTKSDKDIELIADAYLGGKVTDAVGFSTFSFYREFLIKSGNDKWTPEKESLYKKLCLEQPLTEDEKLSSLLFFPPLKLRVTGFTKDNQNNVIPFDLKFAVSPLIPSVIKGKTFEAIKDNMLRQNVSIGAFATASKHSSLGMINNEAVTHNNFVNKDGSANTGDWVLNEVAQDFIYEVVPQPEEYKEKVTFSTQLRKLLFVNSFSQGVPVDYTGSKPFSSLSNKEKRIASKIYNLEQKFSEALDNLISMEKDKLLNKIGAKETPEGGYTIDKAKFAQLLEKEFEKRDYPEAILQSLQTINNDFKYPLDSSIYRDTIEQVLLSVIDNRLRRQKGIGEALIQASSVGYESINLERVDDYKQTGGWDLPFYNKKGRTLPDGTKVTSAHKVKIALQGDFKKLLNLADVQTLSTKEDITPLQALNKLIKNEEWLDKKGIRNLITLTGVRIPVQGHNSMEFMEVYEFLPTEAGSVIIVSPLLVSKSGGDFDWDKISTLYNSFNISSKGDITRFNNSSDKYIQKLYNELKDEYEKALQKDSHIENLISAIFGDNLTDDLEEQGLSQDLFSQDKIPSFSKFKEQYLKKYFSNDLNEIIREVLERDENYEQLMTPNSTDIFEPLADSRRQALAEGKSSPQWSDVPNPITSLDQHESNSVGKKSLGILAVTNVLFSQFQKVGAYLNKEYKKNIDNKKARPVNHRLSHNKTKDGNISLSHVKDVSGVYLISDIISQLMNGAVDVAKKDWLFYIHGLTEIIPTFSFLVTTGTPPMEAAAFFNQPILLDYVKSLKNYKSPIVKLLNPTIVPKIEATWGMVNKYLPKDNPLYEKLEDAYRKYKIKEGSQDWYTLVNFVLPGIANEEENIHLFNYDKFKDFAIPDKNHKLAKPNTDEERFAQILYLTQFLEFESIAQTISSIRSTINQDTTKPTSIQASKERLKNKAEVKKHLLMPDSIIDDLSNDSTIKAFTNSKTGIDAFINKISSDIFEITNNRIFYEFVYDKFNQDKDIPFSKKYDIHEDFVKTIKNDFIEYLIKNNSYLPDLSKSQWSYYISNLAPTRGGIFETLQSIKDTYPELVENNMFLQNLVGEPIKLKPTSVTPEYTLLKLNTPDVDSNLSNALTEDYMALLNFRDPSYDPNTHLAIQKFAKDLAIYSLQQSGLNRNKISFTHLLPVYQDGITPIVNAFAQKLKSENPKELAEANKELNNFYTLFKKNNRKFYSGESEEVDEQGYPVSNFYTYNELKLGKRYNQTTALDLLSNRENSLKLKQEKEKEAISLKSSTSPQLFTEKTATDNPQNLYVYPSSLDDNGKYGDMVIKESSRVAHPNTINIPVFKSFSGNLTDKTFADNKILIDQAIQSILHYNKDKSPKNIIFSSTLLDRLQDAPSTKEYLTQQLNDNFGLYPTETKESTDTPIKPGVPELFESNPELLSIGTPEQYSQYLDTIFPDSKIKDIVYHGSDNIFETFDKNVLGKNTQAESAKKGFFFSKNPKTSEDYIEFSPKRLKIEPASTLQGYEGETRLINKHRDKIPNNYIQKTYVYEEGFKEDIEIIKPEHRKDVENILPGIFKYNVYHDNSERNIGDAFANPLVYLKKTVTYQEAKDFIENTKKSNEMSKLYRTLLDIKNPMLFSDNGNIQRENTYSERIDRALSNKNDSVIIEDTVDPYPNLTDLYIVFEPEQIHILGSKQDIEGFRSFVNTTKKESESAEQIYSKLGDKTQSENVVIKPWSELKDATKAITNEGVISTRIKNSNEHFGNPFSSDERLLAQNPSLIKTNSTKESVEKYINWIINGFENKIEGINISSRSTDRLGKRLTNPNWYAKDLMDVESIYKANASKIKAPYLNAEEALKYDMNLMYKLQVQKFQKNPELIDEINERGGLEFIKKSSHIVGVKNSRWEGKGIESNFIKVLTQSYTTVSKQLGKFKETSELNPEQRKWIREQLQSGELKDKPILYYKELGEPSHATALDYLINKYNWDNSENITNFTEDNNNIREEDLGLTDNLSTDDFKC